MASRTAREERFDTSEWLLPGTAPRPSNGEAAQRADEPLAPVTQGAGPPPTAARPVNNVPGQLLVDAQRAASDAASLAARAAECASSASVEASRATSGGIEVAVALARLEARMDVMERSVARRLAASERHAIEWASFEEHADRVEMRLSHLSGAPVV